MHSARSHRQRARGLKNAVDSRVPRQGRVIGPILFIFNNIAANIDPTTCICLFAKYALLYPRIDTIKDQAKAPSQPQLTAGLGQSVAFNTDTCFSMHIMTRNNKYYLDSLQFVCEDLSRNIYNEQVSACYNQLSSPKPIDAAWESSHASP